MLTRFMLCPLGEKLYGASLVTVEPLPRGSDHNITHWRLHAEPVTAWAWQSGLIEFGREVPEGALSFATGMDRALRTIVGGLAREGQGKSQGKLLVPGVPEATTSHQQIDAFIAWVEGCAKSNGFTRFTSASWPRCAPATSQVFLRRFT